MSTATVSRARQANPGSRLRPRFVSGLRRRHTVAGIPLTILLGWTLMLSSIAPPAWAATADTYRLGTGDEIRIQVFGEDDLSLELRLGDSGVIAYPFLGEIQVRGLTPAELESRLVDGLKPDYLVDPSVNVSVLEYRPFFIYGEVEEPGGFPFQPGLTVRQAVALAGGFTERASRRKIVLVGDDGRDVGIVPLEHRVRPGDTLTVEQSFF